VTRICWATPATLATAKAAITTMAARAI